MKLHLPQKDWKTRSLQPPISYKIDVTTGKIPTHKSEFLKVDINTQSEERDSETVAIYLSIFMTVSPEALLNFLNLLHKIIRGQDLSLVPQNFGSTQNLVFREYLRLF